MAALEQLEGIELINDTTELKVKRALDLIDQCDALLANLHRPSYGSGHGNFLCPPHGQNGHRCG